MFIVDMHCDSLIRVGGDRGLVNPYNFSGKLPHLQFTAAFVSAAKRPAEERRAELMHHFNVYLSEKERLGLLGVKSAEDVYSFEDSEMRSSLFSVEGGAGLFPTSPELEVLKMGGLAVYGMAWETNELASSAWDKNDTGLSELGKQMVRKCDSLGIISDVSHLSDKSFYDLCEHYPLPLIATHSNFRDVCDSRRNLTYDMAKKITERGGIIGLNLYPDFVKAEGAALEDLIPHVEYHLERFGENTLAFGFDIDGTSGKSLIGLNPTVSIHDQIIDMLLQRYPTSTVEKIAGENAINFLKGVL